MVYQTESCKYKFLDQEQTNICCPECGERVEENFRFLDPEEQYQANLAINDFQQRRKGNRRFFYFYLGTLGIIHIVWIVVDMMLTAGNNRTGMYTLRTDVTDYPTILILYLFVFSSPNFYPRKMRWALYSKKGLILRLIGFFILVCLSLCFLSPLYYRHILKKCECLGVKALYAKGAQIFFNIMLGFNSLWFLWIAWDDYYAHQFCRKISKFAH